MVKQVQVGDIISFPGYHGLWRVLGVAVNEDGTVTLDVKRIDQQAEGSQTR